MEVPYENAKYNDPASSRGPEKEKALMTEDQRKQVEEVVEQKFAAFQESVGAMMNNLQIEVIRQFQIQQT